MLFTILHQNLPFLEERFEKLNNKHGKADNKHGEAISFNVVSIFESEEDGRQYCLVDVIGCIPKIGDYNLVSVITKTESGQSIVNNVPGESTPESFRDNDFFCDHCNINRYRKEVVIIRDGNDYKQVGKTCLKDYLGEDLETLVNKFKFIYNTCDQANEYLGACSPLVQTIPYMERVSSIIRKVGYISSTKSYDNPGVVPTKDIAWKIYLNPHSEFSKNFIKENDIAIEDVDKNLAEDALDWALSLETNNDFDANLKTIASEENIGYKLCGYVACIIPCYSNYLNKKSEEKHQPNSDWIGNVKDRLEDSAKVVFMKELETQFGLTTLIKFLTKDGNVLTWFASGEPDFSMNEECDIKFTVKKHDEYNGVKQTIVNRVKKM